MLTSWLAGIKLSNQISNEKSENVFRTIPKEESTREVIVVHDEAHIMKMWISNYC